MDRTELHPKLGQERAQLLLPASLGTKTCAVRESRLCGHLARAQEVPSQQEHNGWLGTKGPSATPAQSWGHQLMSTGAEKSSPGRTLSKLQVCVQNKCGSP